MLKVRTAKKDYSETVKICTLKENLKNSTGKLKRLCAGEYYYEIIGDRESFVSKEENQACYNILNFLNNRITDRYEFDNVKETYYDLKKRTIVISPRVKKFKSILRETSLESIIILSYMRACKYKEIYLEGTYEEFYEKIASNEGNYTRIYEKNGSLKTETTVAEEVFNEILKEEFKLEGFVWNYIFETMEKCNYCIENEEAGQFYYFVKDDLEKLAEYYIQKQIIELDEIRKKRRFNLTENHEFKCK